MAKAMTYRSSFGPAKAGLVYCDVMIHLFSRIFSVIQGELVA
jgi:hypothetical protein